MLYFIAPQRLNQAPKNSHSCKLGLVESVLLEISRRVSIVHPTGQLTLRQIPSQLAGQ
jgi:hypothetical protein